MEVVKHSARVKGCAKIKNNSNERFLNMNKKIMSRANGEHHRINRVGWLRAAVLGANDGIISTSSLIIGVASAHTPYSGILIAGIAGWVAGAMSMAAGEYISVSSQADTERADLALEKKELELHRAAETEELTMIYVKRGLEHPLAREVAKQLMAHDALGAHARDELGITEVVIARPLQAAFSSALSFTVGALLPLSVVLVSPSRYLLYIIGFMTIFFLGLLGTVAAEIGGSKRLAGALRVAIWGSLAMVFSASIGHFLGTVV